MVAKIWSRDVQQATRNASIQTEKKDKIMVTLVQVNKALEKAVKPWSNLLQSNTDNTNNFSYQKEV